MMPNSAAGANADCAFSSPFAVDSFAGAAQLISLGGIKSQTKPNKIR